MLESSTPDAQHPIRGYILTEMAEDVPNMVGEDLVSLCLWLWDEDDDDVRPKECSVQPPAIRWSLDNTALLSCER